jgi:8-oxo-dGTP pyrophosphatase MutT (NUDIX family)
MTPSNEPKPTDTDIHCPECDYNLTGATEGRCPWCGWVIDERVLTTMALDRSNARRIGAILTCLVCGGGSLIAVISLVRHGSGLAIRDGLAAVGVLIAVVGHLGLAGMLISGGKRWPIYQRDAGAIFRFAGWFSIALGVIGATELLGSRDVYGIPVAATFEFALAAVFYALPGTALLFMRMVTFRDSGMITALAGRRRMGTPDAPAPAPFVVDVMGRFDEAHVIPSWTGDPQPTTPVVESMIERAWSAATSLAQVENFLLFDGALVRLCEASIQGDALHVALGPTSYRAFVGTNMNPAIVNNEDHHRFQANPLGISASVITRDGFIVYGRRGPRVAYQAGFVHPFGGMVELSDRRTDGTIDLFGAMLRELDEELGVTHGEVSEIVAIALVRDRKLLQPELIFDVSVRHTRRELEQRFDPARSDGEHSEIEFLYDDPDAAIPSLSRLGRASPVAQAAYLLHGRVVWGSEWYDQTCLVLYGELPEALIRTPNPSVQPIPQSR